MSNLIITLISIALAGIVAIMAVFYVGPAFENGQAKAYANTIAQQAVQINNAISQWQADKGGAGFLTAIATQDITCSGSAASSSTSYCGGNPIANTLTPNWLQTMAPPDTNDFAGLNQFWSAMPNRWEVSGSDNADTLQAGTNATYGYFTWLYAVPPITSTAVQVCNQIAILARGANAVPINAAFTNPPPVYVTGENPVLDCYWSATVASGISQISGCVGQGFQGFLSGQVCEIFIAAQVNATF